MEKRGFSRQQRPSRILILTLLSPYMQSERAQMAGQLVQVQGAQERYPDKRLAWVMGEFRGKLRWIPDTEKMRA
jgi:hypothetical protein